MALGDRPVEVLAGGGQQRDVVRLEPDGQHGVERQGGVLRAAAEPVFDAIGNRTIWVGEEPGQASALKLVVNSWLAVVAEGVAEALTAARVLGLDPQLFLEAVKGGGLDAPYVGLKGRAMLEEAFEPTFTVAGGAKDAGLALDAVAAMGLEPDELALVSAAREHLDRAVAEGHGDLDIAATYLSHGTS